MQPHQRLERLWAEALGLPPGNMVVCSSGTAALHLALESHKFLVRPSTIMMPDYSMIACPRAASMARMIPYFIDCGDDLLINPEEVEIQIDWSMRVLMAVHIYGRRCDMEALSTLANPSKTYLVEDMAELHGVPPHPRTDAACWSFYKNKVVHGEEGGAVYFKSPEDADRARKLRCLGFTEDHDYMHVPRGHNYRLADLLATPIIDSLRLMEVHLRKRKLVEEWYDSRIPEAWRMPPRDSVWVYDLRIPGLTLEEQHRIVKALNQESVAARCGFRPMTEQQEYADWGLSDTKAWKLSREVFYLPVNENMTEDEVAGICEKLLEII